MFKTLLTTTAILALTAGSAFAEAKFLHRYRRERALSDELTAVFGEAVPQLLSAPDIDGDFP